MTDGNFVKIYRKMMEWEWYTDVPTTKLFLHCLLKANFVDKAWKGRKIGRGEFWTSLGHLSIETGLTVNQVRTSLKKLASTNEITCESSNKGTKISVVLFDKYQAKGHTDNKRTTNGPQTGHKRATNESQQHKNDKNIKNDKERKERKEYARARESFFSFPEPDSRDEEEELSDAEWEKMMREYDEELLREQQKENKE